MLWMLLLFAAQLILGTLFKPRVVDSSKPATLKEVSVPQIDQSRKIPTIWGTVKIDAAQIGWFGDFESRRQTKKVKSGLFSSTTQTLCFRYYLGIHFAFCHGEVDELKEIWAEDKLAWSGNVTSGDFTLSNVTVFGGDREEDLEKRAEGGLFAKCTFYNGSTSQLQNAYLQSILGTDIPAYRGVSHLVWHGPSSGITSNSVSSQYQLLEPYLSGYVGLSPNLKNMGFVLKRIPKYISAAYWEINSGDANPADVIYEILINEKWGLGLSSALIDSASFLAAAETLFNEGLGFSAEWQRSEQVDTILDEILKYIDGVLYTDPVTGLFTLKLARKDYVVDSLPQVNENNFAEVVSFSRGSLDDSVNEVRVTYIDRFNKYKDASEIAQDLANYRLQGKRNPVTTSYIGISNSTTAGKIAQRDLRTLSTSIIKCNLKVNRELFEARPAGLFRFSWTKRGVTQVVMRITRVNFGEYDNGMMEIEAVQDIFSLSNSIYAVSNGTLWTDPVGTAASITNFETIEAPYYYSDNNHQLMVFAKKPDNSQFSFNTYTSENGSSGNYYLSDAGDGFTPMGTLTADYGNVTSDVDTGSITFSTPSQNLALLQTFNAEAIPQGYNLFYMNGEILAFQTCTLNVDGSVTLSNIWRGLFDTTPQIHASGSTAWFYSYSHAFPSNYFTAGSTIHTKVESVASTTRSSLSTADSVTIVRRSIKPLPPAKFFINGSGTATTITSGDITIAWEHRSREWEGKKIVKQFAAGTAIEPRTEYILKFIKSDGSTLRTVTGLTGLTYTYTSANQSSDNGGSEPTGLTIQLYSKREGLYSLYCQFRGVKRSAGTIPSTPAYSPGSDSYAPVSSADATSISGTNVSTSTPTNGQVLQYNNTTQTWEPTTLASLTVGTINSQTKSANGAVIASNQLIMQTADASFPGLISTGTQTIAGNKTFSGDLIFQMSTVHTPVTLTDASTIAVDAGQGNRFRCTLGSTVGSTRQLGAPSNPTDGQQIFFEITQDSSGSRLLTFASGAGGYSFGTDIPSITLSTTANVTDLITAVYNSTANRWRIAGILHGFS